MKADSRGNDKPTPDNLARNEVYSMNTILPTFPYYPESDGLPMADNSRQFCWIFVIYGNLAALMRDAEDVLVGGNMFWYPVEGHPEIVQAPDVFVVFGRPKGHRRSYQQWKEGGVGMTVVFEILSPGNTPIEMAEKLLFYEDHGVEEYYVYDPDSNHLLIYVRRGTTLVRHRAVTSFSSPRLGIRFDFSGQEMVIVGPDGKRFVTYEELTDERDGAEKQRDEAQKQRDEAQKHCDEAQKQRDEAQKQRLDIQHRAVRLAELSRKARRQQASADELAELERMEQEASTGP